MNPERWARVEALFDRAKLLASEAWPLFLATEAADDIELVDVVLEMLRARAGADFIEPPPTSSGAPSAPGGDAWVGRRFGDFEILAPIGRGGMGLVFKAKQLSLPRDVALKILPFQHLSRPSHVARFEKEARVAAKLRHPNLAQIYAVGQDRDEHWFAMELIDGPDLAAELARLKGAGSPAGERLPAHGTTEFTVVAARVIAEAADALDAAHRAGVIHRDVKPGNLLLDRDGRVRVVDFGLARDDDPNRLTRTGEALGTPHYMSPEQVRRQRAKIDARTDVYSLGVVLYELLTKRKPFEGSSSHEVWSKITKKEPAKLRKVAPRVPPDLATICEKAMQKEPRDRYATAAELRDDLRRFLAREAITAKPLPLPRRVGRWIVRHRSVVGMAAVAVVVALVAMEWTERNARQEAIAGDAATVRATLEAPSWDERIEEVAKAREAARRIDAAGGADDRGARAVVEAFRRRLADDRAERMAKGIERLHEGMADRLDAARFGPWRSGSSERELGEAMRIFTLAAALHPDDEMRELAKVDTTFPTVSIRLAEETRASAPRADEARVWVRAIDDVLGVVGPPRSFDAALRQASRVPPGHWRFIVEVPDWGFAELSRYLVPSVQTVELVARVLPSQDLAAGMKRIEGGEFEWRPDPRYRLGRWEMSTRTSFDSFSIDEAELSNREFVAYVEASGVEWPKLWIASLGVKTTWRELPLGDAADRWLDLPVVGLDFAEATACAEWYGKRLPTIVELERAHRGAEGLWTPWEGLDAPDDGGQCNLGGVSFPPLASIDARFAVYLRSALPTRSEAHRQRPEGLFHALGNVAESTDTFLVEEVGGRLTVFPWSRLNAASHWYVARDTASLAARSQVGVGRQYVRLDVGIRCARSAAALP